MRSLQWGSGVSIDKGATPQWKDPEELLGIFHKVVLWGQLSNSSPRLAAALGAYRRLDRSVLNRGRQVPDTRHQRRSGLSPAEVRAFVDGYVAGRTARELGAEVGVSRQTVVRHLKRNGVTIRRRPLTVDEAARAVALYGQGWSLAKVGELLSRDATTVSQILERAGVPRRDTQGRNR